MEKKSRIRFNPVSKEIEIEGSESFVKIYFDKIQAMLSMPFAKAAPAKRGRRKAITAEAATAKKAEKKAKPAKPSRVKKASKVVKSAVSRKVRKVRKAGKKGSARKRITNIDAVVSLVQGAPEGISTTDLKTKTGLTERQIWSIVNRASKEGRILKVKRGVYGGGTAQGAI